MSSAYPLAWPEGWPRTPPSRQVDGRYHFKKVSWRDGQRKPYTFAEARDALMAEIGRLGASGVVLSTNFVISNTTGLPRPDRRTPEDQGVAIYFNRGGKPLAMACDRYMGAAENMNSLRLALEAMRQLERHGGGLMAEKAFTGFAALPPPKTCWEILGVAQGASEREVREAWRSRAQNLHPDRQGGTHTAMAELNAARDAALKLIGEKA